jgi:hypothetical protein
VRFSPITFSLAACLRLVMPLGNSVELDEVTSHVDAYELDHGR